jgi:prephenate dehydrogenase
LPVPPRFEKICIVGVGLIGGAVALAAKKLGLAGKVAGYCRRPEAVEAALSAGAVDECSSDLRTSAAGADFVVLCTGPASIADIGARIADCLAENAVVTDVASVKGSLVAECRKVFEGRARFIGSHPLAGSEKRGVEHSQEFDLSGAVCVITPDQDSDQEALTVVREFWSELGMRVLELSPEAHDFCLARTSHVPHMTAAAICSTIEENDSDFCASGFRDTTRVASGSADIWTEIGMFNRQALSVELRRLSQQLNQVADFLEAGDSAALRSFLEDGAKQRKKILERK